MQLWIFTHALSVGRSMKSHFRASWSLRLSSGFIVSAERDRGVLPVAFDPDCLRPGHSGAFAIGAFRHRGRLSRSKADFPTSQLSKCTFSLRHSDFLHFAAVPEAVKKRPKGTLAKSRKPLRHSH